MHADSTPARRAALGTWLRVNDSWYACAWAGRGRPASRRDVLDGGSRQRRVDDDAGGRGARRVSGVRGRAGDEDGAVAMGDLGGGDGPHDDAAGRFGDLFFVLALDFHPDEAHFGCWALCWCGGAGGFLRKMGLFQVGPDSFALRLIRLFAPLKDHVSEDAWAQ